MSAPLLRLNEKYRPASAPPALQSVTFTPPSVYSFALEREVLAERTKKPQSRFLNVEVRFRQTSTKTKMPFQVTGVVLLQKLSAVCGAKVQHVEVNGRVIVKLEDYVSFSEDDLIQVAIEEEVMAVRVEDEEDRIPCDKCGLPIKVSAYLDHEKSCVV
jgi:hypothetical protein